MVDSLKIEATKLCLPVLPLHDFGAKPSNISSGTVDGLAATYNRHWFSVLTISCSVPAAYSFRIKSSGFVDFIA